MLQFSANLGFLWTELELPSAIHAAAQAGFNAVECHWPYDTDAGVVRAALEETGLPMLGLNTRRGDMAAGENGLAALPGREAEAQAAIDEAVEYADSVGAQAVHVMAGLTPADEAAKDTFIRNLSYAAHRAGALTVLIEPLNRFDAPGYFLSDTVQALDIMDRVKAPNLKLMFDCYHVGRTEGRVTERLTDLLPQIGHIQFASVPERGAPDTGTLDYNVVFENIRALGWTRPLGAEYRPNGPTEASLGWMSIYSLGQDCA